MTVHVGKQVLSCRALHLGLTCCHEVITIVLVCVRASGLISVCLCMYYSVWESSAYVWVVCISTYELPVATELVIEGRETYLQRFDAVTLIKFCHCV